MTDASRVALVIHECMSIIKDSPDPSVPIDSCHLSANCVEGRSTEMQDWREETTYLCGGLREGRKQPFGPCKAKYGCHGFPLALMYLTYGVTVKILGYAEP